VCVDDISVNREVKREGGLGLGVNIGICRLECLCKEEAIVPR
jgi:hypothetical protein